MGGRWGGGGGGGGEGETDDYRERKKKKKVLPIFNDKSLLTAPEGITGSWQSMHEDLCMTPRFDFCMGCCAGLVMRICVYHLSGCVMWQKVCLSASDFRMCWYVVYCLLPFQR